MAELVSAKAMAELWDVPVSKVTRWCKEGKIPGAEQDKPGSPWRIPIVASMPEQHGAPKRPPVRQPEERLQTTTANNSPVAEKDPEKKKEGQHKNRGWVIFWCIIIGISLLLIADCLIDNYLDRPRYEQGDFSKEECEYYSCHEPATWRLITFSRQYPYYYCDEHQSEGQEKYERYISYSDEKSSKKGEKDSYGHDRFDAIVIAKTAVMERLKSPSTAEFCGNSDYTVTCLGDTWTVRGTVDAQNGFGAVLRSSFTVKFTFSSSDRYTIDSCSIS